MRKLIKFEGDDGVPVLVAVQVVDSTVGRTKGSEPPTEKVDRSFESEVRGSIQTGCRFIAAALGQLQREGKVADAEVEIGIGFTSKGCGYIAEVPEEGAIRVKIQLPQHKQPSFNSSPRTWDEEASKLDRQSSFSNL